MDGYYPVHCQIVSSCILWDIVASYFIPYHNIISQPAANFLKDVLSTEMSCLIIQIDWPQIAKHGPSYLALCRHLGTVLVLPKWLQVARIRMKSCANLPVNRT